MLLLAEEHLERLWEGAKAIDMDLGLTRAALQQLVYDTVDANGMSSGAWAAVSHSICPEPFLGKRFTAERLGLHEYRCYTPCARSSVMLLTYIAI